MLNTSSLEKDISLDFLKQRKAYSYNIIYIFRAIGHLGKSLPNLFNFLKIGQTSISAHDNWEDITQDEINRCAQKRITGITNTSGLDYELIYATIAIKKNEDGSLF